MKKLVLLGIAILFCCKSFAQKIDTTAIIHTVLYQLSHHPKQLSEKQAIDLALHPGKMDTVRIDTLLTASSFAPLPFFHHWHYTISFLPVSFKNGQWFTGNIITIYKGYTSENEIFAGIMLICLLYCFRLNQVNAQRIKYDFLDGAVTLGNLHTSVREYKLKCRVGSLLKNEIMWPMFLCFVILCTVFGGSVPMLKSTTISIISVIRWFVAVAIMACVLRIIYTSKTLQSIKSEYGVLV